MKKILLVAIMLLFALSMQAQQRCAVFQFQAGEGVNEEDIEGISYIFRSNFHPAGYNVLEHARVVRAVEQRGFKQTEMSPQQLLKVGRDLDALVIVVGTLSKFMDEYSVTIDVTKVENNQRLASENATFARSEYRNNMKTLVEKLTSKLEKISSSNGGNVSDGSANTRKPSATTSARSGVEILYGYLKIFPNEIGTFQSEPTSVITRINSQAQHGYNNWRIPTNEELSILRANNYLGSGEYMTRESKHGIVLLVTDGDDYATVQKEAEEEAARIRAQREAEEKARLAKERRINELKSQGYVDLGLGSGTLWRNQDESGVCYTYEDALNKFGDNLPSKWQFEELKSACRWTWNGSGYKVTGPNGNSIFLPAAGWCWCDSRKVNSVGIAGKYWSSTPNGSDLVWTFNFSNESVSGVYGGFKRCNGYSVRLVQKL